MLFECRINYVFYELGKGGNLLYREAEEGNLTAERHDVAVKWPNERIDD